MQCRIDLEFIQAQGYQPAAELSSIILVGGQGTRLAEHRKRITPEAFPALKPDYWYTIGPKGLAFLKPRLANHQLPSKPLTDWHLDIHCAVPQLQHITLGLGFQGELLKNYYETRFKSIYKGRNLNYLVEKNPAGTIAPLVQLFLKEQLPDTPLVYANGDSLMDLDLYQCYLAGLRLAIQAGLDLQKLVIVAATLIPAVESADYGVLELNSHTGTVKAFREKQAHLTPGATLEIGGRLMVPINAGFSIIHHPYHLCSHYLSPAIIDTSRRLNEGLLDYQTHEHLVKYEALFGRVAADGHMVAVISTNSWCDLGTEARLQAAEANFFTALQSLTLTSFC